ncbi:hypothetical protein KY333_05350 [Candidatus Woesearchaeota archaeon]|nr:hypothetical protein [Candidatus Woesearchaeota archaeon]
MANNYLTLIKPQIIDYISGNTIGNENNTIKPVTSILDLYGKGNRFSEKNFDRLPSDLEELSAEAEGIHTGVHFRVVSELERPFEKRMVYAWKKATVNGASTNGFPGIALKPEVARMDKRNLEYLAFAIDNSPRETTPEDFLRTILTHEYGHQVFDEFYLPSVSQVVETRGLPNPRLEKSIGEAFAYWFGEELTGMQHLTEDLAERYSEKMDVQTMKFIYSQLKETSAEHGTRYVIDNFIDIVREGVNRVEDVTLARSTFLEAMERAKSGKIEIGSKYIDFDKKAPASYGLLTQVN